MAPRVRRRAAAETRGVPACMQHSKVQHAGRQPHAPSLRDADPLAKPGKGSAHAADGRRARNAGAGRGKGEAACLWCSGAWRRDVRGRASGWRRPVAPTPRLPAAPLIRRALRPVDPSFSPPTLTHRIALARLQHTLLPSPPPHPTYNNMSGRGKGGKGLGKGGAKRHRKVSCALEPRHRMGISSRTAPSPLQRAHTARSRSCATTSRASPSPPSAVSLVVAV